MSAQVIKMPSVFAAAGPVRPSPGSGATSPCLPAPSILEPPRDNPIPEDRGESPFHAAPATASRAQPAKARWLRGPKAPGRASPAPPDAPALPAVKVDPQSDPSAGLAACGGNYL